MASRAGWNGFAGRIWPAGRSLETPGLYDWYAAIEKHKWLIKWRTFNGLSPNLLLFSCQENGALLRILCFILWHSLCFASCNTKFTAKRKCCRIFFYFVHFCLYPTRGGTWSGVPESIPAGFCVFLSDPDPESKISEKPDPESLSISAVAGVCVIIS